MRWKDTPEMIELKAAMLGRDKRGQPLMAAGPWDCFQELRAATLAAAGISNNRDLENSFVSESGCSAKSLRSSPAR